jgi:hypothetical protein
MNAKYLAPTLGALLLCSSTLALAGDFRGRDDGLTQYQGWHDSRADRHWHEFLQHRAWRQNYWYPAHPHGNWTPAPAWRHDRFAYRNYERDGVTIIFRGRVN